MSQFHVIGQLLGANFNSVADQAIPLWPGKAAIVTHIIVTNASLSLTLAAGGVYTGAGKTGTIVVPAAQVYSVLTGAGLALVIPAAIAVRVLTGQVFLALTTGQGAAATADVYVCGIAADQ